MRDWKAIGKKLLFPPIWLSVMLVIFSTGALICVFVKGMEESIIAYIIYVVSFYALVVLGALCWKVIPRRYRAVKSKMNENKYVNMYLSDAVFKNNIGLFRSLGINIIFVLVNIVSACVYRTFWFGIFAMYYAIIAMIHFLLVIYVRKNQIGKNRRGELRRARLCAGILMTVNLVLTGSILMMVFFDRGFNYKGILIYVVATYTFYITYAAVHDMIRYRKYQSPVMSITKITKLATALFSMLFLETAMFAQFGAETSAEVKKLMIMLTGAGISVAIVTMAIYMIVQTTREIKQYKHNKERD